MRTRSEDGPRDTEVATAEPVASEAFEALEAATIAIAQELTLERVLQVIVDRVRLLVRARYAALGMPDEGGRIDRFITSGLSEEERRATGHPPLGTGLLGVIVEEGRPLRVDDVQADARHAPLPPNHPPMRSLLGVPIRVEGHVIGRLYLSDKEAKADFTDQDQRLVEAFARHAGLAIHNARLHEELQRLAVLRERDRIGQDLHDGIIQALYAVSLSLEDMSESLVSDPADASERADRAIEAIHSIIRDIRNFIMGLRPEALSEADLAAGLTALADEFRSSTLVDVVVESGSRYQLSPDATLQLMHLTREALSNVARHASASLVRVSLTSEDGLLRLTISDDGRGFDPEAAREPGHHGLVNMRARAESLGGRLSVESQPGQGARVLLELPLAAAAVPHDADR